MFNAPLSREKAEYLVQALALSPADDVVDLGCGEGAFSRLLASQYQFNGVGVDNNQQLIDIANTKLAEQPYADNVQYICADAAQYVEDMACVDGIVCIGAEFIFGGYRDLLRLATSRLNPDGKLLVGTIYWKQSPPSDYLAIMDGQNPYFDLYTTVKLAYDAGFVPLEVHRSSDDEWDMFESVTARRRYMEAPDTDQSALRDRAWQWQSGYLQWGVDTMGFCFLILQLLSK